MKEHGLGNKEFWLESDSPGENVGEDKGEPTKQSPLFGVWVPSPIGNHLCCPLDLSGGLHQVHGISLLLSKIPQKI